MRRILIPIFALLAYFAVPSAAKASITATANTCNAVLHSTSVTCTASVTSGNTVVMIGISYSGASATTLGCSDNKSNVYKIANVLEQGTVSGTSMQICYGAITTTASTTFTFTPLANDFTGIIVQEFTGILTSSSPLDQTAMNVSATGTSPAISLPFTTTTASQVVIAAMQINASGATTCPSGYTEIAKNNAFAVVSFETCYKILSSTSTETGVTFSSPNAQVGMTLTSLSETAPGLTGSGLYLPDHGCGGWTFGAKPNSVSCIMAVKANNYIILMSQSGLTTAATNAGCSDSQSNTYTYVTRRNGTGFTTKICWAQAASAGPIAVTWTPTGADWMSVAAIEVAGIKSGSEIDQVAGNDSGVGSSSNATSGTTSATTNANDLIIANLADGASGTYSCGSGYTLLVSFPTQIGSSSQSIVCYKIVSTTGTQSTTFTSPSGVWAASIAALGGNASGTNLFGPNGTLFSPR